MFELTLCVNTDKQAFIDKFYKTIASEIKSKSGIIIKQKYLGKYYLAIAVHDTQKDYLKSKVLDFITDIIICSYKETFFKNAITVFGTKLDDAFFSAISLFDRDLDKEIIASQIEFKEEIVIESFYYFKLSMLRTRWQKTALIITQNGILQSEQAIVDVLKYLCAMSENNIVFASINIQKNKLVLDWFESQKVYKISHSGVSECLAEIIRLNPNKINISEKLKDEKYSAVTNALVNIFEDKIYFVE